MRMDSVLFIMPIGMWSHARVAAQECDCCVPRSIDELRDYENLQECFASQQARQSQKRRDIILIHTAPDSPATTSEKGTYTPCLSTMEGS